MLLACSGPGAGQAMADSIAFGNIAAAVTLALLVAACLIHIWAVSGQYWILWFYLLPMAVHPAWTIGVTQGDCGAEKVQASIVWVVVALFVLSGATRNGHRSECMPPRQFSLRALLLLFPAIGGLILLAQVQIPAISMMLAAAYAVTAIALRLL